MPPTRKGRGKETNGNKKRTFDTNFPQRKGKSIAAHDQRKKFRPPQ